MPSAMDYSNNTTPTWCLGCGDFSVLRSLQGAAARLDIAPHNLAVVSGIGCSGRISGYLNVYGFHSIHGRALPVAQGIKLVNPELTVIAAGGDGDGFAIGTAHTIHAIRRNIDITYVVMNNQVYGLTKGHTSPLSTTGFITKSTPHGSIESPIKPGILALSAGATFVAQGFSGYQEQLVHILTKAILHKGFSFVNVFSPCVTFNKTNTYQWFREHLLNLDDIDNYDSHSLQSAMNQYLATDGLFTGILYENDDPDYYSKLPGERGSAVVHQNLDISDQFNQLMEDFY
ncbi:2-oxoglutarate ferredoxin oxidoreductase subunit beta [Geosporobacter subterraneus DSM 17957]|uniref:2-oxoglutarate ferredoxin oxidoreductase subunit beta n=1 Tax=Geosporobacter subterraneus DSM 17957 TaxID=1121919 RepID=A0A1M6QBK8_9FIRM|nr:2-oxoacid:ferredoxin oxidoreductase subunit beta [Geosporobacter subterraneus]SHK17477.1 2-oxoglutarate ferredoxin oxidoreductase subunit beta [Geosporobacter subterraneus DSM 17957]